MKIEADSLTGRIKELHTEFKLEFFRTNNKEQAIRYLKQIESKCKHSISLDIETSGLDFVVDKLLGIGVGFGTNKALYISFVSMRYTEIVEVLTYISNLPQKKIMHNSFFDRKFCLGGYKVDVPCDYDTYTYAHTLYTDRQYYDEGLGLKDLTSWLLPFGDYEQELVEYKKNYCKTHKMKLAEFKYDLIPEEVMSPYCCMDCISTLQLFNIFEKKVREYEKSTWDKVREVINIKHEANDLYIKASVKGVKINREKVLEIHNKLKEELDIFIKEVLTSEEVKKAEKIIKRNALIKMQEKRKTIAPLSRCRKEWKNTSFNISSNQHKTVLFFDVMGLKPIEKTDSGAPSVDVGTIEHFAEQGIEIMGKIDKVNKINKILTAFLNVEKGDSENKGLWGLSSNEHPYIHPNYNINGTISSRLSTTNSNVAQYPSKGLGKIVKKCLEVEEGYKWIAMDFRSFEVAILSFLACEPNIKNMLENEYDPHSFTAYNVFKNEMELESTEIHDIMKEVQEKYNKTFRARAKGINFLIPYDGGSVGLSKSIGCTKKEAQSMLDSYFNSNKKVAEYMKNNKLFANANGYVENYYGARLFLRNVKNYNPFRHNINKNWKAISEYRVTTNFCIQSFNSFYLYNCLLSFFKDIKERRLDISLLFTVYDSVMLRVNNGVSNDTVLELLRKHFEVIKEGVPFGIDVSTCKEGERDWYGYEDVNLYRTNNKEILNSLNKGDKYGRSLG